jgi:hypothetical protein
MFIIVTLTARDVTAYTQNPVLVTHILRDNV